jgi:hypothetical protein
MSQEMRDLAILFIHLIVTLAKVLRPGGTRAVIAESLLIKHQLLVLTRSRRRSPPLRPSDRVIDAPIPDFSPGTPATFCAPSAYWLV